MDLPVAFVLGLLLLSGWLIGQIRFCMVSALGQVRHGEWRSLRMILIICLVISSVLFLLGTVGSHKPIQLSGSWLVIMGGLIFGISAVLNRGCFVGTTVQLSGGDLSALLPVVGWIIGFRLFRMPQSLPLLTPHLWLTLVSLMGILVLIVHANQRVTEVARSQTSWRATIACGLMIGLIDNDYWRWSPSALANAIANPNTLTHDWVGIFLLLGMASEAAYSRRFRLQQLNWRQWNRLPCGVAMALGSSLALGGNDTQLFRYIPGGSPHSWLAMPSMATGILLGLWLAQRGK